MDKTIEKKPYWVEFITIGEFGGVEYTGYSKEYCIQCIDDYKSMLDNWEYHGWESEELLQHEVEHWENNLNKIEEYEEKYKYYETQNENEWS